MKVCIVGNSGHSAQFVEEGMAVSDTVFGGYCQSYAGEDLSLLEAAFSKCRLTPVRYQDYGTMMEQEKPDVLIVDSMFCDHGMYTCDALDRGVFVFCEKPLALSLEEYRKVVEAEKRSQATVWAMQTLRYVPWNYRAKQLILQGAVGEIRMIQCQKSYQLGSRPEFFRHREKSGGMIPWVAIHGIDLIQYMCSAPFSSVYALQSNLFNRGNGDLEMTASCMFELENGVIATVNADYYRPQGAAAHGDDRVRIVGTQGILEIMEENVYLLHEGQQDNHLMKWTRPEEIPSIFGQFLCRCRGETGGLLNTEQSLTSTRMALLARDSAECKKVLYIKEP